MVLGKKPFFVFLLLSALLLSVHSYAVTEELTDEEKKVRALEQKSLAEKIEGPKITQQVKNYREQQEITKKLQVYNKLLSSMKQQAQGLDEVVRQKKLEILQQRIKENNNRLKLLKKYS